MNCLGLCDSKKGGTREYWMSNRGQGFPVVIRLGSSPFLPSPVSKLDKWHTVTCWRERSRIIRRRESQVLCTYIIQYSLGWAMAAGPGLEDFWPFFLFGWSLSRLKCECSKTFILNSHYYPHWKNSSGSSNFELSDINDSGSTDLPLKTAAQNRA